MFWRILSFEPCFTPGSCAIVVIYEYPVSVRDAFESCVQTIHQSWHDPVVYYRGQTADIPAATGWLQPLYTAPSSLPPPHPSLVAHPPPPPSNIAVCAALYLASILFSPPPTPNPPTFQYRLHLAQPSSRSPSPPTPLPPHTAPLPTHPNIPCPGLFDITYPLPQPHILVSVL